MTEQTTDREDAITDVALDKLATDLRRYALRSVALCEGCDLLVHHTDLTTHARECEKLRAMAAEVVDG